ncbi:glycerol-3-phosphate 1-O-acyltransferase PlsY [Pokkaliibacter plantistimulans]|nr:glycerol-3-phosphate 1-O-acyltransferase PlsY [Pokkaliibacter plantistimulans]
MPELLVLAALLILAYLLGSMNSAILICRCFNLPDPRQHGSGNPGATNVLRLGGKLPALLTLCGDVSKGVIPTITADYLHFLPLGLSLVALAAVMGHLFPVFFGFAGGKGVATAFGSILAISLPLAVSLLLCWLAGARVLQRSSGGALCAALAAPVLSYWLAPAYLPLMLALCAILMFRHGDNWRSWHLPPK